MTFRSYSRKDFLLDSEFPLHPVEDFTLNGTPASLAPGHPQEWGQEQDGFDFWRDFERNFGNGDGESVSTTAM